MGKQVDFNVTDSLKKLEKSLENIAPSVEDAINAAVKDLAYASYASIVAKAQAELTTTRQDYLNGLDFIDLGGNNFVITLDGDWANSLEEGFSSFDMTSKMLASSKMVEIGNRAGSSWVQTSQPKGKEKETHKFAHVPFERNPTSKAAGTSNMADAIREMTATNAAGMKQKLTSIFKDGSGNPMQGKVAVGKSENPMVDGLTKYQKTYINESGKSTTQSVYINYRTVSENGKPWIHPGFKGLKAFEEAEKEIVKQIDNILRVLT